MTEPSNRDRTPEDLSNEEANISFFSHSRDGASQCSPETMGTILDGIACAIDCCVRRKVDMDMFVCVQGNRLVPVVSRRVELKSKDFSARLVSATNGLLHFVTTEGSYNFNLIVVGGGTTWAIKEDLQPPKQQEESEKDNKQGRDKDNKQATTAATKTRATTAAAATMKPPTLTD